MMFVIPQFKVTFDGHDWIVNGEDQVDVLCKILRWNGITSYSVKPHNPLVHEPTGEKE